MSRLITLLLLTLSTSLVWALEGDRDQPATVEADEVEYDFRTGKRTYKGNVIVVGRESASDSLYDGNIVTFEDDAGAYDQKDAEGFIRLNALRLRIRSEADLPTERYVNIWASSSPEASPSCLRSMSCADNWR